MWNNNFIEDHEKVESNKWSTSNSAEVLQVNSDADF